MDFCLREDFLLVSITVLVIGLFKFSISSWFSFGKLNFSKNMSISSKLSIFIGISLLIVISYDHLYFCVVCCNFYIFISNFIDLILLSFYLMSLFNDLFILFIFSKNKLLSLLIFAMVSFVSFAFISALNFYDFFPSTNPGVLHLFFF